MAAITWRNIENNSNGAYAVAMRGLAGAQAGINAGLNDFSQALESRRQTGIKQEDMNLEAQRNSFLDSLSQIRDPNQLAQMQASGEIDNMMAGLDPRVRAQVRDEAARRLQTARSAQQADWQFSDMDFERNSPEAAAVSTALASYDYKGARAAAEQVADPRRRAALMGSISQAEIAADRNSLENQLRRAQLVNQQVQAQAAAANLDHLQGQRAAERTAAQVQELTKDNIYSGGSLSSDKNLEDIANFAKTHIADEDERAKVIRRISNLARSGVKSADGKKVLEHEIPLDLVKAAILESKDSWLPWDDQGDDVIRIINSRMNSTKVADDFTTILGLRGEKVKNPVTKR